MDPKGKSWFHVMPAREVNVALGRGRSEPSLWEVPLMFAGASVVRGWPLLGRVASGTCQPGGPILSLSAAIFLAGPTCATEPRGRDGMRGAEEQTPC
jgi:hypothetical protein